MKTLLTNTKGASLPLVTGLIVLIFTAAVATNELVLRNLRSVQNIEASNRAYLAAEAGIEDALYELSSKEAGYQTRRKNVFQIPGGPTWQADWGIDGLSGTASFTEELPNEDKLVIPLYRDTSGDSDAGILFGDNAINEDSIEITDIRTGLNNLIFTLKIPGNITSGFGVDVLQIDSDSDGKINEDPDDLSKVTCEVNGQFFEVEDNDCDGSENEDGPSDPIILWRLTDGAGNTLTPSKGCLGISTGSEICESDFVELNDWSVELDETESGIVNNDANATPQTIQQFIQMAGQEAKLQMEFTVAVPLVHKEDAPNYKEIKLPKLDVTISSTSTEIPRPLFTVESDGYYQDFKQSITTTVLPKTIIPLFDFTFIQQRR